MAATVEAQEMETPPKKKSRHLIMPVASAKAPCGIPACTRLRDVWEALVKYHDELDIPGAEDASTLWPEAMTQIEVTFIRQNVDQCCATSSWTMFEGPRAISTVFYCVQDADALVEARFVHEVTHALRYALASLANSKGGAKKWSLDTPEKPPLTPHMKSLFKLDEDHPHSGYFVEHDIYGGITVLLTGHIRTSESDTPMKLDTPMMVTIKMLEDTHVPAMLGDTPLGKTWKKLSLNNGESIWYCGHHHRE